MHFSQSRVWPQCGPYSKVWGARFGPGGDDDGARGSVAAALCDGHLVGAGCRSAVRRVRFYDTRIVPHKA